MTWLDFELYKRILAHPKETFAEQKGKASWRSTLAPLAVAMFLLAVSITLAAILFDPETSSAGLFGFIAFAVGSFLGVIIFFGIFFATTFITYEVAVLLGSKCDYKTHAYVTSLIAVPLLLIEIPLSFLFAILRVKDANPLQYVSTAYQFLAYREIHGFSTARTIGMFVIAILIAIMVVLFLVAGLTIAAPGLLQSLASAQ